jgi:transposase
MRFQAYNPDQSYLLPPNAAEVLGPDHVCFFVHRMIDRLDLSGFTASYLEAGRPAYAPAMMVKVWLYAYILGITSSRRIEQWLHEDLAFRYLAGSAMPDFWALNRFRRRHPLALNTLFTQVVEWARIRRQIRRWQKQCDAMDAADGPSGHRLEPSAREALEKRLATIPQRLERLRKSGQAKRSSTDPDSRFLRARRGFVLGYTATMAVSEDHLILAQEVTQRTNDNEALVPLVASVIERCGQRPQRVSADSGFFSVANLQVMDAQGIDAYIPDANLARVLNRGMPGGCPGRVRTPVPRRLRQKLRTRAGHAVYRKRKSIVELVFGVLEEQRGMRRFRLRGLSAVASEMTWAAIAFNLTRSWQQRPAFATTG